MNETRTYTVDGMELRVPLRTDRQSGKPIEDYGEWIDHAVYTPSGYRVLFSGTDACPHAREAAPGGCPDCGSCRYYRRAARRTWIGICVHEKNRQSERENILLTL